MISELNNQTRFDVLSTQITNQTNNYANNQTINYLK